MKSLSIQQLLVIFIISLTITAAGSAQTTDDVLGILVSKQVITKNEADSIRTAAAEKAKKDKAPKFNLTSGKALSLGGYSQFRYQAFQEGDISKKDALDLRRIRLDFKGIIASDWDFRLQLDFATAPKLIDAYVNYTLNDQLKVTVGQAKIPFSYENLAADDRFETIERSQVVEALVARSKDPIGNQNGRDIGVLVGGSAFQVNGLNLIDYTLGVFNGQGFNIAVDSNKAKDFAGRLILHPVKGLDFGGSYYNGFDVISKKNTVRSRLGFELKYVLDDLTVISEFIRGRDGIVDRNGWYAAVAYTIIPRKLQPVLKYDTYNSDINKTNLKTSAYLIGANYWFNDWIRIQLNYTIKTEKAKEIRNDVAAAQLQIVF